MRRIVNVTLAIGAILLVAGFRGESDLRWDQRYPGPWKEDPNPSISRTLAKNHVSGCAQYRHRQHYRSSTEYWVHCEESGVSYLVFTSDETTVRLPRTR